MTTAAIIQARMGSSRLPGKVLRPIGVHTMLEKTVLRLRRASTLDMIIVATTRSAEDDPLEAEAARIGVDLVRGDTLDVLARFGCVLELHPEIDVVVRVTADCPFIDPQIVDDVVSLREKHDLDFAANRLPPPASRRYPVGLDVEVASREALEVALTEAVLPHHREHVMPYLYENRDRFSVELLPLDEDLSSFRWTVDTFDDLQAVIELEKLAGPEPFGWREVLAVARSNPWIGDINLDAGQKVVTEVDSRWRGDAATSTEVRASP